jgi:transposase
MKHSVIGMDIAKEVFQLHSVDGQTGEIQRHKLRRSKVSEFFANHTPVQVAIEACGGAHWWARQLQAQGHTPVLIAPRSVRPFVLRNKTDAADARAIWTAVQQPEARLVAIKTEAQQAILALHRMRAQLMKFRIMQTNALRGILYEFGEVLATGHERLAKEIPQALERIELRLPAMLIDTLREQWARVQSIQTQISAIEKRLAEALRESSPCQQVAQIPGVGLLSATAAVAAMGDAKSFRSGREFAASLGLVPRQSGTGGRVRQLGISKRGDPYLRTLLMHGARSLVARRKEHCPWIQGLLARRPYSVVVAALANKLARTIWAVLMRGQAYDPSKFLREAPA